jgi:galactan 5-O-arabinofuranosyltransferase
MAARLATIAWGRAGRIGLEALAAVVPALAFAAWASTIDVNPMQRIGQVSAMATLQLRFAVCAVILVAAMLAAHRWGSERTRALAIRLGCAAAAGLATGLVAGGIVAALHGTPFSLWAGRDDYVPMIEALHTRDLSNLQDHYPPLFPVLLGVWSSLSDQPAAYALQQLQIVGTALFGPAAYLAWRLVLRPAWALAIGVVAMLPFIEPVKPYPQITLVMLVPVVVALLRRLRNSAGLPLPRAALVGGAYGLLLGVLFLLYSGWFVWLAPGVLVAAAVVVPWRTGWRSAVTLAGTALVVFTAVSFIHLRALFSSTGGSSDKFFYFDTCTDPAYIATWFNDRPFFAGPFWPLPGELGGVDLFTVVLVAGAGVALALGWRRTAVIGIGFGMLSAWLFRMWLAGAMQESGTVRLYPRTTAVMLYGLLLLTGLAVYFAAQAARGRFDRARLAPTAILLIPLLFLFASAGSATINRYMPNERFDSTGWFAWIAHTDVQYDTDGVCSPYAGVHCGEHWVVPPNPCRPGAEPATQYRSLEVNRRAG